MQQIAQEPKRVGGYWVWASSEGEVQVRFVGRGPKRRAPEVLGCLGEEEGLQVAWTHQVHSAAVVAARPGACGTGDALWTARAGLALAVATADCVPLLLAGPGVVAAVHAGWRGIAAGVVAASVAALPAPPHLLTAWIGPAIGPCCYEVGDDVATAVAEAAGAAVVHPRARARPHLDLPAAAGVQLAAVGVTRLHRVERCTRCAAGALFSYRRQGRGAGRNLALVWRRRGGAGSPAGRGRRP